MTCFFLFHPDLAVEKKHVLTRVNAPLISYNEPVMKAKMVIRGQINGHPKRSMVKNCRILLFSLPSSGSPGDVRSNLVKNTDNWS